MKIELRKVKHVKALSEETACYTAEVYIDGELCATARNDGRGGNTFLRPYPGKRELLTKLDEYAASLPPVQTGMADPLDPTKKFSYKRTADELVDKALHEHLDRQDMKRTLKRTIAFYHDGTVRTFKKGHTFPRAQIDAQLAKQHPGAVVLNDLPEDEALRLWTSTETK